MIFRRLSAIGLAACFSYLVAVKPATAGLVLQVVVDTPTSQEATWVWTPEPDLDFEGQLYALNWIGGIGVRSDGAGTGSWTVEVLGRHGVQGDSGDADPLGEQFPGHAYHVTMDQVTNGFEPIVEAGVVGHSPHHDRFVVTIGPGRTDGTVDITLRGIHLVPEPAGQLLLAVGLGVTLLARVIGRRRISALVRDRVRDDRVGPPSLLPSHPRRPLS